MAQGSTHTLTERYLELLGEVTKLADRDAKNCLLVTRVGRIQQRRADSEQLDEFDKKLFEFFEHEWDHQYLVCTALRRIGNKRRHDWSKDYLYVFILAGKFGFGVESSSFKEHFQKEVDRHYRLEAHHAQHTQYGGVISKLDVEETAIDQLARSLYRNKGVLDEANMLRYLPSFKCAEHLVWFKQFIQQHKALMQDVYQSYVAMEKQHSA